MEVHELLEQMNSLLSQGNKVSDVEKLLGFSDGQARKQLSKAGYKFDRKANGYIPKDNVVTDSNGVTTQKNKPIVTHSNTKLQRVPNSPTFSVEQVDILHKMIEEYKTRMQIQSLDTEDKGKTINRNIRVYEKQYEVFANWCKANNVTQADALYKAIEWIMNGNN